MEYNSLNYITIDKADLGLIDFKEFLQENSLNLKTSLDGTKVILKWDPNITNPASLEKIASKGPVLSHKQVLDLVGTSDWFESQHLLPK